MLALKNKAKCDLQIAIYHQTIDGLIPSIVYLALLVPNKDLYKIY